MNNLNHKKANNQIPMNLEKLTNELKQKDDKYSKLSRRLKIVYLIFIPFYIIITAFELIEDYSIFVLIKGICFTLAMSIFAIIFSHYHKKYKNVDYSESTLIMLKKAANRYKPFKRELIWALFSVLLMDIGLSLDVSRFDIDYQFQLIFWGAFAIAIIIGLLIWYYKYKTLRDNSLRLIKEIEGD